VKTAVPSTGRWKTEGRTDGTDNYDCIYWWLGASESEGENSAQMMEIVADPSVSRSFQMHPVGLCSIAILSRVDHCQHPCSYSPTLKPTPGISPYKIQIGSALRKDNPKPTPPSSSIIPSSASPLSAQDHRASKPLHGFLSTNLRSTCLTVHRIWGGNWQYSEERPVRVVSVCSALIHSSSAIFCLIQ
jgi:hypothetical protein